MKKLALLALFLLTFSGLSLANDTSTGAAPKVIGVLFHADWCGSCKTLDPKLTAVKPEFAGQPVLFTQVDLTDEFTIEQSGMLAASLGIEKVYQQYGEKTGFMLLLNASDMSVVDTITKGLSETEIAAKITAALGRAS